MAEDTKANPIPKKKFLEKIWESSAEEKKLVRSFKNLFRIIWAATARFKDDEDLMRAGAIAFQVIVSAIPLLVVGLFVLDTVGDFKTYEALAKEFARKNDLTVDVSIYFNLFYSLLDNKGALTGIGLLIVIYSATSILKKKEEAMNRIWGVKKPRPFMIRIAFFVLVIVFGPFLIGIGIQSGQNLVSQFASPSLLSVRLFQESAVIVGDKHLYIERKEDGDWKYKNILDKIDFETQKSTIVFDSSMNKRLVGEELIPYEDRIRQANYSQTSRASFMDIAKAGDLTIIITNSGSIITSLIDPEDEDQIWKIRHFQRVDGKVLIPARFKKIRMWDDKNGTIIGDRGLILKTRDGGVTWEPSFVAGFKEDLNSVEKVAEGKYLAVGQNFSALVSENSGDSWKVYENHLATLGSNPLNSPDRKNNLNSVIRKGNSMYICGDAGTILYSKDRGITWVKKDIGMKGIDFHDLLFLDEDHGVVVGDNGSIRYTTDGGYHWKKSTSGTTEDLWSAVYDSEGKNIIITGSNYKLLANLKGVEDLSEFQIIKRSPYWRVGISILGNVLIPFILIWLVFFLLYKGLPNTNVEFKSASIGAVVTAVLWVIFLVGFRYYALHFLNTKFAIYGALAAIPLFLLLVNLSVMIVLYGAEIAYLIQNPAMSHVTYKQRVLKRIEQHQVAWGLSILKVVFDNFHNGKGETIEKQILKICHHDENEFLKLVDTFEKNAWIGRYRDGSWTPIVSADNIKIRDVIVAIAPSGYDIEDFTEKDAFKTKLEEIFSRIEKSRDEILADTRLSHLL
ncbi:MAG: YihY/virulence factor BrkB family protein [Leptospira sp.]|nr:YihY/virulence factor BrkB family protein [Leptospira sp.]